MSLGGKRILAIDWDRRDLRLVLARPQAEGVDLLKAVSVPIPQDVVMDDPQSLGAFLREAVRQAKVGARRVVISIPRDQVVLNTLSVPAGPASELASIVRFQIAKELPFAVEQATLDFAVAGRIDSQTPSSLLVAAVRNEQLEFYKSVAREAGLQVERIGLRPHANLIAVLAKSPEHALKSLLLVEVGPQLTEIDIIRDGALAFSRAASVALPDLEPVSEDRLKDSRIDSLPLLERGRDERSRKAVGEVMVEVIRSFEAYRATEPAAQVDQVVVCGATGIESELGEMLGARFGVPTEPFSPERALSLPPQRAKELRGFSAALGLALGHGGEGLAHFDFLHPKKPVSKRTIRLKKVPTVVLTGAFLISALVAAHIRYVSPLVAEERRLAGEISAEKKGENVVLDFKAQVEAVEDWQASEQYWPDVIKTLTQVFPSDREAYATRLDFETKRPQKKARLRPSTVRMTLRTAALGQVNELASALRQHGFQEVRAGKDTPFSGRMLAEAVYHFDTNIDAELVARAVTAPRDDAEEKEEEEFPVEKAKGSTEGAVRSTPAVPRTGQGASRAGPAAMPTSAPASAAPREESPEPEIPDATTPAGAPPTEEGVEPEEGASPTEDAERAEESDAGKDESRHADDSESEEAAEPAAEPEAAPKDEEGAPADEQAESAESEGGAS